MIALDILRPCAGSTLSSERRKKLCLLTRHKKRVLIRPSRTQGRTVFTVVVTHCVIAAKRRERLHHLMLIPQQDTPRKGSTPLNSLFLDPVTFENHRLDGQVDMDKKRQRGKERWEEKGRQWI